MAILRYTNDELRSLRASPLVRKPDRLPPIEQWIDESQQQVSSSTDKAARATPARIPRSTVSGDKSPMGNFSTGQRPSLLHTRTAGSKSGDDFISSQNRIEFASARSITRLTSFTTESANTEGFGEEQNATDPRTGGERHHTRKPTSAFDRENWSTVRERRALAEGEHTRTESDGEKSLRQFRELDKADRRWPAREVRRQNGDKQAGGWRDRDSNRRDRPWERNEPNEREPEWFDEAPAVKQSDDFSAMSQARTQEDFLKWKASMNANQKPQQDLLSEEAPPAPPAQAQTKKPAESLNIEGLIDPLFGSMQSVRSPDSVNMSSKGAKASRFASMFKKEESAETAVIEPPALQASTPAVSQGRKDDKEGFQRILQMLGGPALNINATPSPVEPRSPPKTAVTGARQRSRFFDAAKGPENTSAAMPPLDPTHMQAFPSAANGERTNDQSAATRPQHERSNSSYHGGASTPDINLQNILAKQRPQRSAASNKDSEFLLGLLQGAGARPASQASQMNQQHEPHAPQPRAPPPPGHIDEQLLRNAPHDLARGPALQRESGLDSANAQHFPRAPPGFDDQSRMLQMIQQRSASDLAPHPPQHFDPGQPRRPPGLPPGIAPHPHPMHHQQQPQQQTGPPMIGQQTHDMPYMQPPPPGLPPHLRHPQGFANIPNIFQAPQQPMQPQPPRFPNTTAVNNMPAQQNGNCPPGLGRGVSPVGSNQIPPGLVGYNGIPPNMQAPNGVYGRVQQPNVYEQRR